MLINFASPGFSETFSAEHERDTEKMWWNGISEIMFLRFSWTRHTQSRQSSWRGIFFFRASVERFSVTLSSPGYCFLASGRLFRMIYKRTHDSTWLNLDETISYLNPFNPLEGNSRPRWPVKPLWLYNLELFSDILLALCVINSMISVSVRRSKQPRSS